MKPRRLMAAVILAVIAAATLLAPFVAPHDPHEQYADYPYAPPMRPHIVHEDGTWSAPFVYPVQLVDRLSVAYVERRAAPMPASAAWRRSLERTAPQPIFFLGTDALGRDLLSRLLFGARASLGIAAAATVGALLIGTLIGAIAGYARGLFDDLAMRVAEVILVLPALYVVLALRASLPLVLEPWEVFLGVAAVLSIVGWPLVARGVRGIVVVESRLAYADAARACGASGARVLFRHVLPATTGFIGTQAALLVPAFAIAEATLSFAGFGFAEPTPSWGTMLQEAANVRTLGEYPWLLAPAAAIALVSWAMHALVGADREAVLLMRNAELRT